MARKKKSGGRKLFRYILGFILILFVSSSLYVIACRWVEPPITITQIGSLAEGYGLKRSYVNYSNISRNVKLAAIASEDQLFPEHGGFDWKSIDKSMNRPAPEEACASRRRGQHHQPAGS